MENKIFSINGISGQVGGTGSSPIFSDAHNKENNSNMPSNIIFQNSTKSGSFKNELDCDDDVITKEERRSFYKDVLKANYI